MTSGKDIVLACCRDEEDIIVTFIEFYLAMGFDAVYLVDNDSRDATPALIDACIARGWPVVRKSDSRPGYERFLSEHFHWAGADADPRWLFFLDCDEMILFPDGDAKAYLDAVDPEVDCLRLRDREMYPLPAPQAAPHSYLLTTRTEPTYNDTFKEVSRYDPRAFVYGGKHLIEYPGIRRSDVTDIFIRHYRFRSPEQARHKIVNANAAMQAVSPEEMARICAFAPAIAAEWAEYLRDCEEQELWRSAFAPQAGVEDSGLARWAAANLPRR